MNIAKDVFIPLDGTLFKAVKDKQITPGEFSVYSMILYQANWETGVWTGNIDDLYRGFAGQIGKKTLAGKLNGLIDKSYLRSFHIQGQKGFYQIAIPGYRVRFGPHKRKILDSKITFSAKSVNDLHYVVESTKSSLEASGKASMEESQVASLVIPTTDNQLTA